jgi:hypothetical protein
MLALPERIRKIRKKLLHRGRVRVIGSKQYPAELSVCVAPPSCSLYLKEWADLKEATILAQLPLKKGSTSRQYLTALMYSLQQQKN